MSSRAIHFDGVWKKFNRGELHDSLRDLVPAAARRIIRGKPAAGRLRGEEFWAVRNVSFEVAPGETLGIIGPNGAGKSTVLKLLTGILRPTAGTTYVPGRVGALIEIAAGFHPDLTGRENIFLQGAIMGMRRGEIAEQFDRIVEFAGLPDFIDTQVKRYSSGMNARLGFAIAAHLNPDALLIDEVLAVGDYAFQKRAFGRIGEMAKRDIPVVVVSHQLERIASLCTKAVVLDRGRVVEQGDVNRCISAYIAGQEARPTDEQAGPEAHLLRRLFLDSTRSVRSGERIRIRSVGSVNGLSAVEMEDRSIVFSVRELQGGQELFKTGTRGLGVEPPESGEFEISLSLQMNVPPGLYSVDSLVWDARSAAIKHWGPSVTLQVTEGPDFKGTVQMNPEMRAEPLAPV